MTAIPVAGRWKPEKMTMNAKQPVATSSSRKAPDAAKKYHPFPAPDMSARTWPSKRIEKALIWCSVDLR